MFWSQTDEVLIRVLHPIAVGLWENHCEVLISSYKVGLTLGFTFKTLLSNKP